MSKKITEKVLRFKWTVSRDRDTYGYNICSLYVNGTKVSSCNGGGYDMQGTALGNWITDNFQDKLKKLPANYGSCDNHKGFYGLSFYNSKTKKRQSRWSKDVNRAYVDGGCGFSSVERIIKAMKMNLKYIDGKIDGETYLLTV